MVTFAPVTTAPEESTTVPARLPRTDDSADPCANAGTVKAVSRAKTAKPTTNFLAMCATPCVVNFIVICFEELDSWTCCGSCNQPHTSPVFGERNPTLLKHRWCQLSRSSSQSDALFSAT